MNARERRRGPPHARRLDSRHHPDPRLGVGMGFGLYEAAFDGRWPLWQHRAQRDHRHNALRRLRQHDRPASQRGVHSCVRMARGLPGLGNPASVDRPPAHRLLVPKAAPAGHEVAGTAYAPSSLPWAMVVLAGVFGMTWFVSTAFAADLPRLLEAWARRRPRRYSRPRLWGRRRSRRAWPNSDFCGEPRR